ncbi:hypothetical protein vseg_002462 [Gypsophila vaccaria]
MVDYDCKTKMVIKSTPNLPTKITVKRAMSATFTSPEKPSGDISPASESACAAYENYLRLSELRELWSSIEFPGWENESVIKPGLMALEITFRFVSIVLSDSRPYVNKREWGRRLESLAREQVEIIGALCEEDTTRGGTGAPIVDLTTSFGEVVPQTGSSAEVWKLGDEQTVVVSRVSEASLLPRLATWHKSEEFSSRMFYDIESGMRRCGYTLGLGEPNLEGKPNLDYDAVCRPVQLHALKKSALEQHVDNNYENHILYTIHQILESWVFTARQLHMRICDRINKSQFSKAADDCWTLEKIWNLLERIENLHVLMDPDDFLHLKTQLRMKTVSQNDTFCFRSRGLTEMTKLSKDLRHKVPGILGVEVDPMGGPRIQEAAMGLYRERRRSEKVHLLQAFQGVEAAVKRFFFNYKQLLVVMMGSLEANKGVSGGVVGGTSLDLLTQLFMEPTYYPSLDAAKTYIGDFWERDSSLRRENRMAK